MGESMNAGTCYAVVAVFFTISVITTLLRFYTRLSLLRKFSADDYILLAGFILLIVYTAIYTRVIHYLFLRPFLELGLQGISDIYKWAFIMLPFYLVASALVKMSIALRLLKFTGEAPILRWIVIVALTIYEMDVIVMIAVNFTQCLLPIFPWTRPFKVATGPHCATQYTLRQTGWVFGAFTTFLDFTLAIVPWFIVRKLWMTNLRTRVMLSLLLGLGSIASLATIARMFYNYKFTYNLPDPITAGNFFLWTYLELALATTACSAATLKPLVVKVLRIATSVGGSEQRTKTTTSGNSSSSSSGWSAYFRRFSPFGSRIASKSETTETKSSVRPAGFSFHHIFYSSKPRVLRHPLSLRSLNTRQTTTQNMSQNYSQNMTQNTTQFSRTFNESSDEDDRAHMHSEQNGSESRRSHYESLEAQIQYALQDV